jgi:hypothetical protein
LRKGRGGKEQRRKGVRDKNKTFYFVGIPVLCLKKNAIRNRKARRAK